MEIYVELKEENWAHLQNTVANLKHAFLCASQYASHQNWCQPIDVIFANENSIAHLSLQRNIINTLLHSWKSIDKAEYNSASQKHIIYLRLEIPTKDFKNTRLCPRNKTMLKQYEDIESTSFKSINSGQKAHTYTMAYSHGNLLHWNFQRPIYLGQTITFTIQNADTLIMNTTIAHAICI